ncbi:hypothetical protein TRFO_14297 [Tritrichomonas foetus]|uniref:Uncharacterized protein n=1 Tax=Tritrichomonas foetus TaxID=1144522 RepID=A0A1J4KVI9_9EUKA|nr:hypothetical protein TRFO_14297 [Tritrichomonas foetus]|eukprot:OHT15255.1 hypothetical protein TRFO_14297 [Tritrichomonas foetus]
MKLILNVSVNNLFHLKHQKNSSSQKMKKGRTCLYPKGTYQTPSFFFRGGDEYKENEHLQSEYFAAKNECKRAKKELDEARAEYEKVKAILDDKEGHAVALAESLGGNNAVTTEHANLRKKIAELTVDIEDINHSILEAKSHASPSTVAAMDRERSSYFLTIENLQLKLEQMEKSTQNRQNKLFEIISSPEWHEAIQISCEHQIQFRINENLRLRIKNAFEQQNYGDSSQQPPLKRVIDNSNYPELHQLLQRRHQLQIQCQEMVQERTFAQIRRRVSIATMLDELAKLDDALVSLGEEGINLNELRRMYLPDGPLTPLKRPKSSATPSRSQSGCITPKCATGRSRSDIKRPFGGGRGACLSPM